MNAVVPYTALRYKSGVGEGAIGWQLKRKHLGNLTPGDICGSGQKYLGSYRPG